MANFSPHFLFPDVSHWRPVADWNAFLSYSAVACKTTQGTGNVDPIWHDLRNRAVAKNVPVIAYHFMERSDGRAQATHFLRHAGLGNPLVVPALDVELNRGTYPTADQVRAFWMEVYAKFPNRKGKGLMYVGAPQWNNNIAGNKTGLGTGYTHLWLPNWGSTQDDRLAPATGWSTVSARQYADNGDIKGVTQHGDMNRYNGTPASFRQRHLPSGAGMGEQWKAPDWPGRVLARGDNHPAIAWVQGLFNTWKIKDTFATNELGIFGPKTEGTVKEFQRLIDVGATGELDQATWHRIVNKFQGDDTDVLPAPPTQPTQPREATDSMAFTLNEEDRDWLRELEIDTRNYLKQVVLDAEQRLGTWMKREMVAMEQRLIEAQPGPHPAIRSEEFTDNPSG